MWRVDYDPLVNYGVYVGPQRWANMTIPNGDMRVMSLMCDLCVKINIIWYYVMVILLIIIIYYASGQLGYPYESKMNMVHN